MKLLLDTNFYDVLLFGDFSSLFFFQTIVVYHTDGRVYYAFLYTHARRVFIIKFHYIVVS